LVKCDQHGLVQVFTYATAKVQPLEQAASTPDRVHYLEMLKDLKEMSLGETLAKWSFIFANDWVFINSLAK